MHPRYWTKLYEQTHGPSHHTYVSLDLSSNPIILLPGQVRAVYIHSTLPGDEAIVYDNRRQRRSYDDALVSVLTGRAHVSERPFGRRPIWGWGNPWRDQREFVGRIEFGAVYKLWNPATKDLFGKNFQAIVRTLFLCQRKWESPLSKLPDDCIFYILNMCRWDWAGDGGVDMKELRRKRRLRLEQQKQEAERAQELARVQELQDTESDGEEEEQGGGEEDAAATSCCNRLRSVNSDDNDNDDDAVVTDANVVSASRVVAGTAVAVEEKEEDDNDDDSEYDPQAGTSAYYDDDDDEEEEDEVLQDAHDNDSDSELQDEEVAEAFGVAARNETVHVEALQGDDSDVWANSDDDDDDDEDDDDSYEGDNFRYHDDDSDNDSDDDEDDHRGGVSIYGADRRAWIRRQFARVHILQQLANMEEQGVIELNF